MRVYVDTSVVVSLMVLDANTDRARRLTPSEFIVSDLTAAEFASALTIRIRTGSLTRDEVRRAHSLFDAWRTRNAESADVLSADFRAAETIIRTLDYRLKTADATHIVIARRLGATLATFDAAMAREAPRLGLTLVEV
ncbi:type II toxin-antitoxin system VapC family toxin [Phenylobacterium sp.]|uniref:type II toxin-antitoxin system VapC family toxin n=1 Tax=Phenylobacterium sp. TaxID=1871053 RepID=UPI00286A6D62|nr:type II toxin-antitoxin system VapC family toxin [Phenylobacterium sp.]